VWKVLIADDEPKIRKGIRSVFDSEIKNVEIVGEAEDGEIALEIAQQTQPDIYLVDICMPFLNGIDLIKHLKTLNQDAKIIIISGHDEFDYAQQALKLQVFDYILKPFVAVNLVQTVNKAIDELEVHAKNKKYLEWADQQLKRNVPIIREAFFKDFVDGKLTEYELNRQIGFLELTFGENIGMIIVKLEEKANRFEPDEEVDRLRLLFAAQNIVEEQLSDLKPCYTFKDDQSNIVGIVNISKDTNLELYAGKIKSMIENYLNHSAIVCYARQLGNFDTVPETYKNLLGEMKEKNSASPIVRRIKQYIESHYSENGLSLQEVAEAVNVSPAYLSRLLKNEEGYSFIEYLTIVRIKMAIRYMDDVNIKIVDVAEKVGYSTQHYFSTAFKKILGVSPSQYRRGSFEDDQE